MVKLELDNITKIEEIDCKYLTSIMRQAGFDDVTVIGFNREPAGGKSHGGGAVHRFKLNYLDSVSSSVPTSIILKESREIPSQVLDPGFARREVECYKNSLYEDIHEKLYIPKAYNLTLQPEQGLYWIWMEDLGEIAFNIEWTLDNLSKAIRDIAEFHAKWWGRTSEFKEKSFLRHRAQAMYDGLWSDRIRQQCEAIVGHPQENIISKVFTPKRCEYLVKLSKAQDLVYPKLDALPQTILHHDIWTPNLGSYNGKTALIDWSYVGQGTPGADLSQTAALLFQMWSPDLEDEALLNALWTGLREDWDLPVKYEEIVAGYELTFCLRPAHALGGPVLGAILSGKVSMVGNNDIEWRLASAEATFRRIEKGLKRLE
jgi:thiamine kinase-like enzyme